MVLSLQWDDIWDLGPLCRNNFKVVGVVRGGGNSFHNLMLEMNGPRVVWGRLPQLTLTLFIIFKQSNSIRYWWFSDIISSSSWFHDLLVMGGLSFGFVRASWMVAEQILLEKKPRSVNWKQQGKNWTLSFNIDFLQWNFFHWPSPVHCSGLPHLPWLPAAWDTTPSSSTVFSFWEVSSWEDASIPRTTASSSEGWNLFSLLVSKILKAEKKMYICTSVDYVDDQKETLFQIYWFAFNSVITIVLASLTVDLTAATSSNSRSEVEKLFLQKFFVEIVASNLAAGVLSQILFFLMKHKKCKMLNIS